MLVLGRQQEETVVLTVPPSDVEQKIVLTVVDFRQQTGKSGQLLPRRVRLGFEAEKVVRINRGEVQDKIDQQREVMP
jgi:sRNA-binding carbon storage regulator CsrA